MIRIAVVVLCGAVAVFAYGADVSASAGLDVAREHHHAYVLEQQACTARAYANARNQLAVLDASAVIYQQPVVEAGLDEFASYLQQALDPGLDCAGMQLELASMDRDMIALGMQRALSLPSAGWQERVDGYCPALSRHKDRAFRALVRVSAASHLWALVAQACAPADKHQSITGTGY